MARRVTTRGMSDRHEADLAEALDMTLMPGSGNQFNRPMDARHNRYERRFAFAVDGKSTKGSSIGISREMVEKATEQAGAERPLIGLRWYHNERLTEHTDWVALTLDDFLELIEAARG